MTRERRKQKQGHMLMWSMLTAQLAPVLSWHYLLEWAALGGSGEQLP